MILGFSTVRSIAISASVFDLFEGVDEDGFKMEDFWAYSIGCAVAAKVIANNEPDMDEDLAFVFGLLHGIGKVVLDQYAHDEFVQIHNLARNRAVSFQSVEREILDTDHIEIGHWLAEKWKLPPELIEAIGAQKTIADAGDSKLLVATIHFASFLCLRKGVGGAGDFHDAHLDREAWDVLSFPKDKLPKIVKQFNEELILSGAFMSSTQV